MKRATPPEMLGAVTLERCQKAARFTAYRMKDNIRAFYDMGTEDLEALAMLAMIRWPPNHTTDSYLFSRAKNGIIDGIRSLHKTRSRGASKRERVRLLSLDAPNGNGRLRDNCLKDSLASRESGVEDFIAQHDNLSVLFTITKAYDAKVESQREGKWRTFKGRPRPTATQLAEAYLELKTMDAVGERFGISGSRVSQRFTELRAIARHLQKIGAVA